MGLHLIPNNLNINFVGLRKVSYCISIVLILVGLASLAIKGGPSFGIDFAGGTVVQIKFDQQLSDAELKKALADSDLPGLVVQSFGETSQDYLLRLSSNEDVSAQMVRDTVNAAFAQNLPGQTYEIQRLEMVGPKMGADFRTKALEALYLATLLMSVYISGRFEHRWGTALIMAVVLGGSMLGLDAIGVPKGLQIIGVTLVTLAVCWRLKLAFALGAMISILHDLFITVGIFSLLDKEFDLTIIAALLTVVGYSLNDTIIVFDRIRENLRGNRSPLTNIINSSINQTMSRTVLTSLTTLLVVVALLILGGDIIFDFALALFIGILVGTFSSIFVASPILLVFEKTIQTRQIKQEEDAKEAAKRAANRSHDGAQV
ncbi:protein translocase subunit SecF [Desulfovibrio sp. OttesenSCG-928-C06]|nr:protein translocase subunit SecF [Desulfovibrio sp. OttesenSCG-928-C06]